MRFPWIAMVGFLAASAVALAQEGRGRGPGRGQPSVGFTALDTNGDGVLDAGEIAAAPAALARLDKNSDGRITSDEARPAMPQGRGGGRGEGRGEGGDNAADVVEDTVKTLMAFDANGDGKLSRSELPDRFQGLFDRADLNHDGFVTPDEIRKMAAAQAPPPEPEGRGGRGRGNGPGGEMNFIRFDPILAAVDTDGDGVLSAEEIRNAAVAIRKLDKDGDGKVTREEAMPQRGPGRQ
jgi:Ca2+-binding EF-hand superfamily protein